MYRFDIVGLNLTARYVLVATTLLVTVQSVEAYTVKTYQGLGTTRIEACTLARQSALSPTAEAAHGRLIKVTACQCGNKSKPGSPAHWACRVETTHER
jgi:hypothetical protein